MKRVHKGVEYDNDGEIKFGANSGNGNVSLWKRGQEQNFIFTVHIELSNNTLACYTKGGQCGSSECVVDSLQFVCQNGQVLIADLMNG